MMSVLLLLVSILLPTVSPRRRVHREPKINDEGARASCGGEARCRHAPYDHVEVLCVLSASDTSVLRNVDRYRLFRPQRLMIVAGQHHRDLVLAGAELMPAEL